ncbi:hypothetical protein AYO20_10444 [Fonsecaea nubica]|uniref:Uncharacterized protein n=1 Tax=Fonsecaea nubica TaxID=856822 RepID=A0A178C9E7_9EURO|nr:hypothetical protein AYO20_10444 [Fonsecaea nubica]OAL25603.1 hypothetical protein AYO20_10444 [Fonsecaea nubica]
MGKTMAEDEPPALKYHHQRRKSFSALAVHCEADFLASVRHACVLKFWHFDGICTTRFHLHAVLFGLDDKTMRPRPRSSEDEDSADNRKDDEENGQLRLQLLRPEGAYAGSRTEEPVRVDKPGFVVVDVLMIALELSPVVVSLKDRDRTICPDVGAWFWAKFTRNGHRNRGKGARIEQLRSDSDLSEGRNLRRRSDTRRKQTEQSAGVLETMEKKEEKWLNGNQAEEQLIDLGRRRAPTSRWVADLVDR